MKQLKPQLLSALSQADLAFIESHELSHQARVVVLSRLRWLQGDEPLPGYDALSGEEILRTLAEADGETVKAVREYERRHRDRLEVRDAVARVLPTASASESEDRVREEEAGVCVKDSRAETRLPPASRIRSPCRTAARGRTRRRPAETTGLRVSSARFPSAAADRPRADRLGVCGVAALRRQRSCSPVPAPS